MYSRYSVRFVRLWSYGSVQSGSISSSSLLAAQQTWVYARYVGSNDNEQRGSLTSWSSRRILKCQATWMNLVAIGSVTETRKLCDSESCDWGWWKREVRECEPEWWWVWVEARFTLALLTLLTLHLLVLRLHSCVLLAPVRPSLPPLPAAH